MNIKPVSARPYRLRPEDKLYFLHIYKTAGTTLSHLLESRFAADEVCPAHQLEHLARLPRDTLGRYRLYRGHLGFKLADFVPDEVLYVTLLRDPVEHVLSIYEATRRSPELSLHAKVSREGMTLADFVRDEETAALVRNPQVFTLTYWHHVWDARRTARLARDALTPADWAQITREAGVRFPALPGPLLVEVALERLERFAFVGLADRMEDSVRLLAQTFGWGPFAAVPRLNAAPRRMRKDEVPPDTLEVIHDLTRLDAQVYAHALGLFERRLRQLTARAA